MKVLLPSPPNRNFSNTGTLKPILSLLRDAEDTVSVSRQPEEIFCNMFFNHPMSRPKPNPQTVMKWKMGKIYISIRGGRSSQGLEFTNHKKDAQSIEHCEKVIN